MATSPSEQHEFAMLLLDHYEETRNPDFLSEAYKIERSLALEYGPKTEVEPTRSILLKSAANIALRLEDWRGAEQLVGMALSGDPHPEDADDLRNINEQLNFVRHIRQERGLLASEEMVRLTMSGGEVGYGFVLYESFKRKVDHLSRITARVAQGLSGLSFDAGPQANWQPMLCAPSPGSFSVGLRFGPIAQPALAMDSVSSDEVVAKVLDLTEAVEAGDMETVLSFGGDERYGQSLMQLINHLAPDGRKIAIVELTGRSKRERSVKITQRARLTSSRANVARRPQGKESRPSTVVISGILRLASSLAGDSICIVEEPDASTHKKVRFRPDQLRDIAHSYFDQEVRITAKRTRGGGYQYVELVAEDEFDL